MMKIIDCPECNGSGIQMVEFGQCDMDNEDFVFIPESVEIPCENCGGSTFIQLDEDDIIDIKEVRKHEGF
jgi:hypothetical protein